MKKIALLLSILISGCATNQFGKPSLMKIQNRCAEFGHTMRTLPGCVESNLDQAIPNWRIADEDGAAVSIYLDFIKELSSRVANDSMSENEAQFLASQKISELKNQKYYQQRISGQQPAPQAAQSTSSSGLAEFFGAAAGVVGAAASYRSLQQSSQPAYQPIQTPKTCRTVVYTGQLVTQCF